MEDILIIDGYNIIHAWPELAGLMDKEPEHARDKLIDILAEYRVLRNCRIIVVFDAHLVKGGLGGRETRNGVEVIYSQEGETADSVIERLVSMYIKEGRVAVATSDWSQQSFIFGKGAARMPARELVEEVTRLTAEKKEKLQEMVHSNDQRLGTRLNDDIKAVLEKIRRQK
ncbi:NYN domain-containing protein [Thermincola potens]|uniref:NYN domain-containing protein n=1 Tax=Thermincola potens (strain JR) TaxID=635013 RepID=D5X9U0_THEPJ|nr:NYN domain-containing protein [Thermincola potens]ADG81161.1 protein of unknown function DUF901 [Thermincola potens JR]